MNMGAGYLGVDLGTRRIGLAVSEPDSGVISPLDVIKAGENLEQTAREVIRFAREYGVVGVVVGMPLNMDGTEGPQARLSRRLAESITRMMEAENKSLRVYLHDERLTSFEADERMKSRRLTRGKKKSRHDAVAAAILLESFLACGRPDKQSG